MKIGVPKEVKDDEYRVGLTPNSVNELVEGGHKVFIESNAGAEIDFTNEDYEGAGATILKNADEIFKTSDMIVKVKEPQASEYKKLRAGQILFTYLHLASDPEQAKGLMTSGCVAIAYETVTDAFGRLPLLAPMSQVAGRLSIQAGAHCLEKHQGGRGILMGGVPGVFPGKVVVIGGGVVGTNAVRMAMGKEVMVTVIDKSLKRLEELDAQYGGRLNTVYATKASLEEYVTDADLVIGAVLVPGQSAPKLVSAEMVSNMRQGAVVVDVAIDQGGCFETSRPTSHSKPTYVVDGVVHYCVTNMPGVVPRTSTLALNHATLPFVLQLANKGYKRALVENHNLLNGLNVCAGKITCEAVARDLGQPYTPPSTFLA